MRRAYIILVLIVVIGVGFLLFKGKQTVSTSSSTLKPDQQTAQLQYVFENPKKSTHYESNTPYHGAILAGVPINVVVDFNFDLAKPSEIKILNNGQDYGIGETIIDSNKLTMRRNISPNAPDGLYKIEYKACWPDASCHNGYFQFVIDRKLDKGFSDQTNKKEVEIKMSQIKFESQDIKISKGTKVTWVNDDSIEHFVNTDSHPSHTYYKAQNSKALGKDASYSVIFETAGIYPYHCSVHADSMAGNILVE